MWSTDPALHARLVERIQEVASLPDIDQRLLKAAQYASYFRAYPHEAGDSPVNYIGTMMDYAIHGAQFENPPLDGSAVKLPVARDPVPCGLEVFFYVLMRDHLPPGTVEHILAKHVGPAINAGAPTFSNSYLRGMAHDMALRTLDIQP